MIYALVNPSPILKTTHMHVKLRHCRGTLVLGYACVDNKVFHTRDCTVVWGIRIHWVGGHHMQTTETSVSKLQVVEVSSILQLWTRPLPDHFLAMVVCVGRLVKFSDTHNFAITEKFPARNFGHHEAYIQYKLPCRDKQVWFLTVGRQFWATITKNSAALHGVLRSSWD